MFAWEIGSKSDFIELCKKLKPKVIFEYRTGGFFGSFRRVLQFDKNIWETPCYDCLYNAKEELELMGILVIEEK